MKIPAINNINNDYTKPYANPSFGIWTRRTTLPDTFWKQGRINRNDTIIYRKNPNWKDLIRFVLNKYKNVDSVNVYIWGCSDGSDAYTFKMELLTQAPDYIAEKFRTIIAKDIDKVAIKKAKSKMMILSEEEIKAINQNTFDNFNRFFNKGPKSFNNGIGECYIPAPILYDGINFSKGDITKDYKQIAPNNSIVIVKNLWPYIDEWDQAKLAKNLYNQLGKNSILIFGDFDEIGTEEGYPIRETLANAGFIDTEVDYIVEPNPARKAKEIEKKRNKKNFWKNLFR